MPSYESASQRLHSRQLSGVLLSLPPSYLEGVEQSAIDGTTEMVLRAQRVDLLAIAIWTMEDTLSLSRSRI